MMPVDGHLLSIEESSPVPYCKHDTAAPEPGEDRRGPIERRSNNEEKSHKKRIEKKKKKRKRRPDS